MLDPAKPSAARFSELQQAYKQAVTTYGPLKDVSGVDIGYKYVDDKRTDDIAVRVHYRGTSLPKVASFNVLSSFELKPSALIAFKEKPSGSAGVSGVQFIRGAYTLHSEPDSTKAREKLRDPVQPGLSIALLKAAGGTLGMIVYDRATGGECVLSNAHVLAGLIDAKKDSIIVQPAGNHVAPVAGDANPAIVAKLLRWTMDVDGDAAVAVLATKRKVSRAQYGSSVVVRGTDDPTIGDRVQKSGVRTLVTDGFIDGVGRYYLTDDRTGMDGFRIMPLETVDGVPGPADISSAGDSGSVWYRPVDALGIGLHVGGDATPAHPQGQAAIACSLHTVLTRLNVQVEKPVPILANGVDSA